MLHYDDSSRDDWAVEWFHDPRCTNGYTWLVLDDGRVVELADPAMRTPHAGPCRTPRANSAYYGVAAATNGLVPATERQLVSLARICAAVIRHHGWVIDRDQAPTLDQRIVGHDAEALWTSAYTSRRELWGTLGRKVDPTGHLLYVANNDRGSISVWNIAADGSLSQIAGSPFSTPEMFGNNPQYIVLQ